MKKLKNKTAATTIALFLVLTIAVTLVAMVPAVNAADIPTYAFLSVAPNPAGVGQTVTLVMWLNQMPEMGPRGSWDARWPGYTVTVTKPDGTKQTLGPFNSDSVGSRWTTYVPDTVGTYTFQFSFPGWNSTNDPYGSGNYYKPSQSSIVELTVQQQEIEAYPNWPLPTEYWTRPIDPENRLWWSISGNWLGVPFAFGSAYNAYGRFNSYTEAPNTAHIVWTKELGPGGLTGGEFGDIGYYSGIQYEQRFYPTIILDGKLYFNLPLGTWRNAGGFVCVDLRTGEELWWQNTTITMGQIYDYDSPNQHGTIPYLWYIGTTYRVYDPFTGTLLYQFTNAMTGTVTFSKDGSILVYMVGGSYPNRWLAMWNSSAAPALLGGATGTGAWQWRPYGKTIDWRTGIQWNKTFTVPGNPSISRLAGDKFIWRNTYTLPDGLVVASDSAFDLREGREGQLLWGPTNRTAEPSIGMGPYREGVYVSFVKEKMIWYGYDANTGAQIWGPTEPYTDPWGMYGSTAEIAYGKMYTMGYGGTVYCWDVKTGKKLWEYYTGSAGLETPYGHYPQWEGMTVADGKVYVTTYEHSPNSPLSRGARMHCINVETGALVWNILGWYQGSGAAIADGYMVQHNFGDNRVYCFGKGPSATTVTASPKVSVHGNSVLLEGSVTDISAGTKSDALTARFPNGVPAIADEYMTPWMEYLHMQKPIPTNATGVEVTLDTIDPNGNFVHIGTATSDTSGLYSYMFTPEVPGKYTIIATFAGSESYWPSYAETAISVSEAPPATPPPEYPQPIDHTLTIVGTGIAIIIAVAIVGILMLRKK